MGAFYVELTKPSVAAYLESKGKVASTWQSTFSERNGNPNIGRIRRRRKFKQISQACRMAQKNLKAKGLAKSKNKSKSKKKDKKKLPGIKLQSKALNPAMETFSRSDKGSTLIQMEMHRMLDLDKVSFPLRPLVDPETSLCRLKVKLLDCNHGCKMKIVKLKKTCMFKIVQV